jgi:hypothetical protein
MVSNINICPSVTNGQFILNTNSEESHSKISTDSYIGFPEEKPVIYLKEDKQQTLLL